MTSLNTVYNEHLEEKYKECCDKGSDKHLDCGKKTLLASYLKAKDNGYDKFAIDADIVDVMGDYEMRMLYSGLIDADIYELVLVNGHLRIKTMALLDSFGWKVKEMTKVKYINTRYGMRRESEMDGLLLEKTVTFK